MLIYCGHKKLFSCVFNRSTRCCSILLLRPFVQLGGGGILVLHCSCVPGVDAVICWQRQTNGQTVADTCSWVVLAHYSTSRGRGSGSDGGGGTSSAAQATVAAV